MTKEKGKPAIGPRMYSYRRLYPDTDYSLRANECIAIAGLSTTLLNTKGSKMSRKAETKRGTIQHIKKTNENETAKTQRQYTSSSTHTVAPAYNKGAYQVITKLGNATNRVAKRVCKYVSFENMLSLRKQVNSACHHSRSKENASGHLDFWLRKRFNFSYTAPLLFKIPYSPNVSKRDIGSSLVSTIKSMDCPSVLKNHLQSKLKIVFTKRPPVESMLCNHRKFARSFVNKKNVTCR